MRVPSILPFTLITLALAGCATNADLRVETFASDPSLVAVNSYLITGETEALLVDAQIFSADAEAVVELVRSSGKTLTTVFLTHAHPDHYLGLAVIEAAFPDANVVTTPAVLADFNAKAAGTLAFFKTTPLGPQIPDTLGTPTALTGSTLVLDGQTIEVIELSVAGESEVGAALLLPGTSALIAGDLIYNDVHPFLSECNAEGWLDNLAALRATGATSIYPGHGVPTTSAAFEDTAQLIAGVKAVLDASASAEQAKAAIVAEFPVLTGDLLLNNSTEGYFANCKP